MKTPLFTLFLLLQATLLFAQRDSINGKVHRIIDGDTFVLEEDHGFLYKIRLYGIDCPEKGEPYSQEATDFVKKVMPIGIMVSVKSHGIGKYGRVIGEVTIHNVEYMDGRPPMYLNLELVRQGLATHFKRYAPDDMQLAEAEQEAKREQLKLWKEL